MALSRERCVNAVDYDMMADRIAADASQRGWLQGNEMYIAYRPNRLMLLETSLHNFSYLKTYS